MQCADHATAESVENAGPQVRDASVGSDGNSNPNERVTNGLDHARLISDASSQEPKDAETAGFSKREPSLMQPSANLALGEASQGGNAPNSTGASRAGITAVTMEHSLDASPKQQSGDLEKAPNALSPESTLKSAAELSRARVERSALSGDTLPTLQQTKDSAAQAPGQNQSLVLKDGAEAGIEPEVAEKDFAPLPKGEPTSSTRAPSWSVEAAKDAKPTTATQALDRAQAAASEALGTTIRVSAMDGAGALGLERLDELFVATNGSERVSGLNGTVSSAAQSRSVSYPHLAAQLRENLPIPPNKPVEIALSPEELGRVRMVVTQVEAGVAIHITAERQETLDLMRRNLDELTRDLEDLGYTEMSFSFDQEGEAFSEFGSPDDESSSDQHLSPSDHTAVLVSDQGHNATSRPGGLDIRV